MRQREPLHSRCSSPFGHDPRTPDGGAASPQLLAVSEGDDGHAHSTYDAEDYPVSGNRRERWDDDHAHSTHDTPAAGLAAGAPGCRGLHPVGHGRSPGAAAQPPADPRNGCGAVRLPSLAPHHPLRQLPLPDPAHPQRAADPHGSPPAVLERPLHPPHGVASAHAGRGAEGPHLDGQGRLPLSLSLDWPARLPAHRRHGPALALPQRPVLGGQWPGLRGPAVRHRTVEAPGAQLLADRTRRLGYLRPLRHLPPAAGTERLLSLQRPATAGLLRGGVHSSAIGDPDWALDVAGADKSVQVVPAPARQPANRPVTSLPSSCVPSSSSSSAM
jgi:hypothetical protein